MCGKVKAHACSKFDAFGIFVVGSFSFSSVECLRNMPYLAAFLLNASLVFLYILHGTVILIPHFCSPCRPAMCCEDPYGEFFVVADASVPLEDLWNRSLGASPFDSGICSGA